MLYIHPCGQISCEWKFSIIDAVRNVHETVHAVLFLPLGLIAVALLVVALIAVNYLVEIYTYPDVDGTQYYIKKFDGK